MNDLQRKLVNEFSEKIYAHGYMESQSHEVLVGQIYWTRKARNLTQKQLAELSGIAQERISKIESGAVNSLTMSTLRKLSRALDVSLHVGFEPFDQAILNIGKISKDTLAIQPRTESLNSLKTTVAPDNRFGTVLWPSGPLDGHDVATTMTIVSDTVVTNFNLLKQHAVHQLPVRKHARKKSAHA